MNTKPKIKNYFKEAPIHSLVLYTTVLIVIGTAILSLESILFIPFFITMCFIYVHSACIFLDEVEHLDELTKTKTNYYKKDGTPVYRHIQLSIVALLIIALLAAITVIFIAVMLNGI